MTAIDDEDTSGNLPRHAALDPRNGCPACRWEECRCPNPALTAALKVMLTDACWRCSDGDGATCDPCLSELVAAAERDAEARTVMTHLRGLFDPMTGRPAGGGW